MITTGLVVTESQKESEKGTDIKFLGFRPYFLVNPLVLETNVVVASLVPRPPPLRIHNLWHKKCVLGESKNY